MNVSWQHLWFHWRMPGGNIMPILVVLPKDARREQRTPATGTSSIWYWCATVHLWKSSQYQNKFQFICHCKKFHNFCTGWISIKYFCSATSSTCSSLYHQTVCTLFILQIDCLWLAILLPCMAFCTLVLLPDAPSEHLCVHTSLLCDFMAKKFICEEMSLHIMVVSICCNRIRFSHLPWRSMLSKLA